MNRSAGPVVTFWGAARSVTGSMHLLEWGGQRLLLDCGLVRGRRDEAHRHNRHFPFDPERLDAVVLSHAHVDHCGNLPNLVRQGYRGPIFCTPATRDLLEIMLADSARIQQREAHVAAVVGGVRDLGTPALYTPTDAERTLDQCIAVPYDETHEVGPSARLRFVDAGHILGSAITALTLTEGADSWRVTFTGDLGRRGLPYLRDPSSVPAADLVLSESTYGGRRHDTLDVMAAKMGEVVRETAGRGGKVLIPAFSLGRTQVVLHFLERWMRDGLLPRLPLYVDSPLAAKIAEVYRKYPEALRAPREDDDSAAHYLLSREETDDVTLRPGPCVIVASGGMCEGGRILQHLRHHIDDPRSTIVLVSYQAPQTLGAQLLERRPTVRFHGRTWNKWAEVVEMNGFSGHAGHDDFLALLGPAAADTRRVRLVHGEPPQAEALAVALRQHGFADVAVPQREETVAVA